MILIYVLVSLVFLIIATSVALDMRVSTWIMLLDMIWFAIRYNLGMIKDRV